EKAPEGKKIIEQDTAPPPSGTPRTIGFVLGGVGVVGLGVGIATGVVASSKASSAKTDPTLCANKECSSAGRDAIKSAGTMATVSTIGFIGGGVALAAGAVLVLTSKSAPKKKDTTTAHLVPEAGPQGAGLTLAGSF